MTPSNTDFDALVAELHDFRHAGLQAQFTIDREAADLVHVRGVVVDQAGNQVGDRITRTFYYRAGSGCEVQHRGLYLEPDAQGKGFGVGFEKHSVNVYRRHGVVQVSLAAEEIGSFAWRNLGYRLPEEPTVRRQQSVDIWGKHGGRSRAQAAADAGHVQQLRVDEIGELFTAIERGEQEPLEPHEIGDLAQDVSWDEHGRKMWLGRAILTNSKWTGIKKL